jgi:hypothetical protein
MANILFIITFFAQEIKAQGQCDMWSVTAHERLPRKLKEVEVLRKHFLRSTRRTERGWLYLIT